MTPSLKSVSKIALVASGFALLGTACVADGEPYTPKSDLTLDGEYDSSSPLPPVISTDPTLGELPTPVVMAEKQANPQNLLVSGDSVYWVEFAANRVLVKWLSIGGGENLVATQLDSLPFSTVADSSGLYLAASSEQSIVFASHLGMQARPLFSATTDPLAIAVSGGDAYWTTADGCLHRGAKEGGSSIALGCADSAATTLAVVDNAAYLTTADGALYRSELTLNGAFEKILGGHDFGRGIVADADGVSWVSASTRQVLRYDTASAMVTVLAGSQFSPSGIAQDRFYVYFSTQGDGSIKRVSKRGGRVAVMASQQDQPGEIAIGVDSVLWINEGTGAIMSQTKNFNY